MSPALAGRFFTTQPPGKSLDTTWFHTFPTESSMESKYPRPEHVMAPYRLPAPWRASIPPPGACHGSLPPSPKGPALLLAAPKALRHVALPPLYPHPHQRQYRSQEDGQLRVVGTRHPSVATQGDARAQGGAICGAPQARWKQRGKDLIQGGSRQLPGGPVVTAVSFHPQERTVRGRPAGSAPPPELFPGLHTCPLFYIIFFFE